MRFRYLIVLALFLQMVVASTVDLCDCHYAQTTTSQSHCTQCSHQRPVNQVNTFGTKTLPLEVAQNYVQPQQIIDLNVSISGPYRPPSA